MLFFLRKNSHITVCSGGDNSNSSSSSRCDDSKNFKGDIKRFHSLDILSLVFLYVYFNPISNNACYVKNYLCPCG